MVLNHGAVDNILELYQARYSKFTPDQRSDLLWLCSNLSRGKPYPDYNIVSRFLPIVQESVNYDDPVIQENTMWACCYLTEEKNEF